MIRRDDWLVALMAAVDKHRAARFTWGSHDCGILAADCIEAVTGRDLAKKFRGKYADEAGAQAILGKHGFKSAIAVVGRAFHRIPAAQAQVGDIAVIKTPQGLALAPVLGSELAVYRVEGPLGFVDLTEARYAYRIEGVA